MVHHEYTSACGYKGRPLACRLASNEELRKYAGVLKELNKGVIEIALTRNRGRISEEEWTLLEMLLSESGRRVTWISVHGEEMLRKVEPLIARGARPQIRCTPTLFEFTLRSPGLIFPSIAPSWTKVFNQPAEIQKQIYVDRAFRGEFRHKLAAASGSLINWDRVEFAHAKNALFSSLEGKSITQIASARGTDCVDAFLDVAIEDDLGSWFYDDSGRGTDGPTHLRPACDDRAKRRRRARRRALRRRLPNLPARYLGAQKGSDRAGSRG